MLKMCDTLRALADYPEDPDEREDWSAPQEAIPLPNLTVPVFEKVTLVDGVLWPIDYFVYVCRYLLSLRYRKAEHWEKLLSQRWRKRHYLGCCRRRTI